MSASVIIDIAIVAVPVLCLILGAKRGLFRSLAELVALLAALVLAAQAATYAAAFLMERVVYPAAEKAVTEQVEALLAENGSEFSPAEELERMLDALPEGFVRDRAGELLAEMNLPETVSGREPLLKLAMELTETVLDTAVRSLVYIILYLLCFVILLILLRLLIRVLDLPFRLPVLRQLNWLGGVLFGAVKGAVLVWLGVTVLWRLGVSAETVEGSFFLPLLDQWIGFTGEAGIL